MTRNKLVPALFIIIFSVVPTQAAFTCDPVADCAATDPGEKVPDPEDCHNYYICDSNNVPTPTPFACPDGYYFRSIVSPGECVLGEECEDNICDLAKTCSVDCSLSNIDNIPVPGDCTKFYRCGDISDLPGECPENEYFNGEDCVDDASECCTVCDIVCFQANTFIPDPNDCHNYYFCDSNDGPVGTSCPDGYYFNIASSTCDEETEPCSSFCPGGEPNYGIGNSTTSPSTIETKTSSETSGMSTQEMTTETVSVSSTPGELVTVTPPYDCYEGFECPTRTGEYTYCNACIATYYNCKGGEVSKMDCPRGEVFDYTIQSCIEEDSCPTFG